MPTLVPGQFCTGCTACAASCPKCCITMTADDDGFLHPQINCEICVNCGICEQSCPVRNKPNVTAKQPRAYAAYSNDDALRCNSSSGGVFSELARTILALGGAVFGAAYNKHFRVVHICVENETGLAKLRGAKYAQSDLDNSFAG